MTQPGNAIERASTAVVAMPTAGVLGQATAVEVARAVAEVQAAVLVAQQCPRDMLRAFAEMRAACARKGLADRAFYAVVNRGSGPSIHLARELSRIWGNVDSGVRELRRDDAAGTSEILAYAWDQQTNARTNRSFIVPHARMVKKDRVALNDLGDIYLNNQNVGARALRQCIYAILPADFVGEAEEICRKTLRDGDGEPLDKRVENMLALYRDLGVKLAQIESRVGRKRGQWNAGDLADLGIVYRSIQRGETNIDEQFPPVVTAADIQAAAAAASEPGPATGPDPGRAPGAPASPEPPLQPERATSDQVAKQEEPPPARKAAPRKATAEPLPEGPDGWPATAQPPLDNPVQP